MKIYFTTELITNSSYIFSCCLLYECVEYEAVKNIEWGALAGMPQPLAHDATVVARLSSPTFIASHRNIDEFYMGAESWKVHEKVGNNTRDMNSVHQPSGHTASIRSNLIKPSIEGLEGPLQPRPQGILASQYGGGSENTQGHSDLKRSLIGAILTRVLIGLRLPKQSWQIDLTNWRQFFMRLSSYWW